MSILEIKNKLTKEEFLILFPKSKFCFPNKEFGNMNISTQIKLYKILFLNSDNIKQTVGSLQKVFFLMNIFTLLTIILIICAVSYIIMIC